MTGLVLAAASTSGLPFEPVPEYLAAGITVFRLLERITKIRGTLGAY